MYKKYSSTGVGVIAPETFCFKSHEHELADIKAEKVTGSDEVNFHQGHDITVSLNPLVCNCVFVKPYIIGLVFK